MLIYPQTDTPQGESYGQGRKEDWGPRVPHRPVFVSARFRNAEQWPAHIRKPGEGPVWKRSLSLNLVYLGSVHSTHQIPTGQMETRGGSVKFNSFSSWAWQRGISHRRNQWSTLSEIEKSKFEYLFYRSQCQWPERCFLHSQVSIPTIP